jgi:hypothetical protein
MIKIVNLNKESYDIYIGRGSKWGNPFRIGTDGTRIQVVEQYSRWIINQPHLMDSLSELRNKTLGCYCSPLLCHGEILKKLSLHNELINF